MPTGLVVLFILAQQDAGAPVDAGVVDPTVLDLLLRKNILTAPEYEAAIAGLPPPDEGRSPVMNKWAASLYGFVEFDVVGDSTQSFFEQAANGAIARPGTFEGDHARVSIGARNSRLGLKLATPQVNGLRATAIIETDVLGNTVAPTQDMVVFTGAGPRFRHLAITLETPFVDVLIGQFWQLFGMQPNFFPNSVEIQGSVGEIYSRAPQLRLSHVFKRPRLHLEVALAMSRPAERLFGVPDFQGGVRLALPGRKGLRTSGATSTRTDPLMFGVSAVARRYDLMGPLGASGTFGWGVSFDAFVPLLQGSLEQRKHALSLNASFVTGAGIADFQSGFGAGLPPITAVDNGIVGFDPNSNLRPVVWRTFRIGLQYYLPPNGNIWVAVNWAQNVSPNSGGLGEPDKVYVASRLGDVSLWWNPLSALRLGIEYALTWQRYADGVEVTNHRGIFAAFFLF